MKFEDLIEYFRHNLRKGRFWLSFFAIYSMLNQLFPEYIVENEFPRSKRREVVEVEVIDRIFEGSVTYLINQGELLRVEIPVYNLQVRDREGKVYLLLSEERKDIEEGNWYRFEVEPLRRITSYDLWKNSFLHADPGWGSVLYREFKSYGIITGIVK